MADVKMYQQEITPVDLNVFELFYVSLYTDFKSDHCKKFLEASTYNINTEY